MIAWAAIGLASTPGFGAVWTAFNSSNGLPANEVLAVAGTDSGTVLAATRTVAAGSSVSQIVEYDGVTIRRILSRYANPPALGVVRALAAGFDGDVWVATDGNGLYRLGATSFTRYTRADGLGDRLNDVVNAIWVDPDGTVWAGTNEGGLSFLRPGDTSWSTLSTSDGLASVSISDLERGPDGNLWIAHNTISSGLARYDGSSIFQFHHPSGGTKDQYFRIEVGADGRIWAASSFQGLSLFDASGTWSRDFVSGPDLVSNSLTSITEGPHGDVWIGTTDRGVQRWTGATWTHVDVVDPGLLNAQRVSSLFVAPSGVLWVGTRGEGLARYEGSSWLTFGAGHGFPTLRVAALSQGAVSDFGTPPAEGVTRGPVYAALQDVVVPPSVARGTVVRLAGLSAVPILNEADSLVRGDFRAVATVSGGAWAAAKDTIYRIAGTRVVGRFPLPPDTAKNVSSLFVTSTGTVWAGTENLLSNKNVIFRFDGTKFVQLLLPGLTPSRDKASVHAEDASGRIWVATSPDGGTARVDPVGGGFERFGVAEGLPSAEVNDILVAGNGDVWFATLNGGVARLRGSVVDLVADASSGLPSNNANALDEDARGRIWVATDAGVSYYDGLAWTSYGFADGLAGPDTRAILADTSETVIGTFSGGISLFHADRVPPRAAVLAGPPPVLGGRIAQFVFRGGDVDSQNDFVRTAWTLDGGQPRAFSTETFASLFGLADGVHTFEVFARDRALNVTPAPAQFVFEVDATPPQPRIESPVFARAVSGVVPVVGSVDDLRFLSYAVQVRPAGSSVEWATLAADTILPAPGAPLAEWFTEGFPDGNYDLRVVARDTLDLTGFAVVEVIVDNHEPRNVVTSPARVNDQEGGRVFTLNAEVEAYFPPQALGQDRIVSILPLGDPGVLPPGGSRFLGGWRLTPQNFDTEKPVTLTFSLAALDPAGTGFAGTPAVFLVGADTSFTFLGGSVDERLGTLTTTIDRLGDVAVYDGLFAAAAGADRALDIQPRAFSPEGRTFDTQAAVSFDLDEADFVKVYVYDRSGRLVRRVFEGDLPPGRNVIHWDGRAGNGAVVPSGVYLVAVQALGETDVKPVAVVNR